MKKKQVHYHVGSTRRETGLIEKKVESSIERRTFSEVQG